MLWLVVQVLGGRGKLRQVIFAGTKLLRLPGVGEGLGIQLGVADHFAEPGVIVGAVHGGINVVWGAGLVMGSG